MLTLTDPYNPDFKFTFLGYQAEIDLLAASLSEYLEGDAESASESAFAYLYDAATSSPWLTYSNGSIAILVYTEVAYPSVLGVRDSAIWALMVDVAYQIGFGMRDEILESLRLLHDDFFSRNGYRNMSNGYGGR